MHSSNRVIIRSRTVRDRTSFFPGFLTGLAFCR